MATSDPRRFPPPAPSPGYASAYTAAPSTSSNARDYHTNSRRPSNLRPHGSPSTSQSAAWESTPIVPRRQSYPSPMQAPAGWQPNTNPTHQRGPGSFSSFMSGPSHSLSTYQPPDPSVYASPQRYTFSSPVSGPGLVAVSTNGSYRNPSPVVATTRSQPSRNLSYASTSSGGSYSSRPTLQSSQVKSVDTCVRSPDYRDFSSYEASSRPPIADEFTPSSPRHNSANVHNRLPPAQSGRSYQLYEYRDDGDYRYENNSDDRSTTDSERDAYERDRQRRKQIRRERRSTRAHDHLDKKPTLADSTLWAFGKMKMALMGR